MFLLTEKKITPFGILGAVWGFGTDRGGEGRGGEGKGGEGGHADVCLD